VRLGGVSLLSGGVTSIGLAVVVILARVVVDNCGLFVSSSGTPSQTDSPHPLRQICVDENQIIKSLLNKHSIRLPTSISHFKKTCALSGNLKA